MGIYRRGNKWYIDYYLPGGKRVRSYAGETKKLAEKLLSKVQTDILEGKYQINRPDPIYFIEFAREFQEYCRATKKRNTSVFHGNSLKHLKNEFNEYFLADITPYMIEQYKIRRSEEVSASSINRELSTLNHLFELAVEWNKVSKNPVASVKKLKEPPGRIRYLSKEEICRLLKECESGSPHLRIIVYLALNTGMRKGEILALKKNDIDLHNNIITIRGSKVRGRIETTKSGKRRDIPISEALNKELTEYMQTIEEEELFSVNDFKRSFRGALKRADINDFTFHDLRHTFASHLVMGGIDLATVKELMGHATIQMTMRYAHLSPDHRRRALEIIQLMFE